MSEVKITRNFLQPAKKSAVADLKESVFYFAIIMILYYLIMGIWKILSAPFRAIFVTDRAKLERAIKVAKEKMSLRDRLLFYSRDGEDVEGFYILAPVEGRDEDDLDTELMCVPNIYLEDYKGKRYIGEEFLNYFEHQVELHLQAPWGRRHKFLQTINRLYPEFTPKFSVVLSEIESLREEARAARLSKELIDEMVKMNISKYDAKQLLLQNENDPENLMKEIAALVSIHTSRDVTFNQYTLKPR
jgi:hypothetical protein